jgi:hypothetical protein
VENAIPGRRSVGQLPVGVIACPCSQMAPISFTLILALYADTRGRKENTWNAKVTTVSSQVETGSQAQQAHRRKDAAVFQHSSKTATKTVPKEASCERRLPLACL